MDLKDDKVLNEENKKTHDTIMSKIEFFELKAKQNQNYYSNTQISNEHFSKHNNATSLFNFKKAFEYFNNKAIEKLNCDPTWEALDLKDKAQRFEVVNRSYYKKQINELNNKLTNDINDINEINDNEDKTREVNTNKENIHSDNDKIRNNKNDVIYNELPEETNRKTNNAIAINKHKLTNNVDQISKDLVKIKFSDDSEYLLEKHSLKEKDNYTYYLDKIGILINIIN